MKNKMVYVLGCLCIVSVLLMSYVLMNSNGGDSEFVAPKVEESAVEGVPVPPSELEYEQFYQDGMSFSVHMCKKINVSGRKAQVYFTNDKENTLLLKLRITDYDDEVIGETGIIKPNEYLEYIEFNRDMFDTEPIKIKIMAYESDTYYSGGSIDIGTTVNLVKDKKS